MGFDSERISVKIGMNQATASTMTDFGDQIVKISDRIFKRGDAAADLIRLVAIAASGGRQAKTIGRFGCEVVVRRRIQTVMGFDGGPSVPLIDIVTDAVRTVGSKRVSGDTNGPDTVHMFQDFHEGKVMVTAPTVPAVIAYAVGENMASVRG